MNRFLHSVRRHFRENPLWRHVQADRLRETFLEECRSVRRDLHSQKGVTLAFSMVAFTVITVICLSLIQWSENAMRSAVSFTPSDEQAYLTVYSAAALFQDSISTNSLSLYSPPDGVSGENPFPVQSSDPGNAFLNLLRDMAGEVQTSGSSAERVLTVSVTSRNGETYPFREVRAVLAMYDDYQVEAEFSPRNADAPSISLNMNAQTAEETVTLVSPDGENTVLLLKTTVAWPVEKREASGKLS